MFVICITEKICVPTEAIYILENLDERADNWNVERRPQKAFRSGFYFSGRVLFVAEIPGPTRIYTTPVDEEDYNDQFGSAEQDNNDGTSNNVLERIKGVGEATTKTTNASKQEDPKSAKSAVCASYLLLTVLIVFAIWKYVTENLLLCSDNNYYPILSCCTLRCNDNSR